MRFKDLFFLIADTFGRKRPYIEVGPFLGGLSWRVMAVVRLFYRNSLAITKETARAALTESYYNATRIQQEIGFQFTPIEETIQQCVQEYRKQLS